MKLMNFNILSETLVIFFDLFHYTLKLSNSALSFSSHFHFICGNKYTQILMHLTFEPNQLDHRCMVVTHTESYNLIQFL